MKSLKVLLFISIIFLSATSISAQEWKDWERHDIKAFYIEIDEDDSENYYNAEEHDDRWFIPIKLKEDTYSIEIGEKLESKFYKINGTKYFVSFVFAPFLWKWDEGVLVVSGSRGTFYKKKD